MHYGASLWTGSQSIQAFTTGAHGAIPTGRRTGGFDGNDVSQLRQIYECDPAFVDSPTAVSLASGYSCAGGAAFTGATPTE